MGALQLTADRVKGTRDDVSQGTDAGGFQVGTLQSTANGGKGTRAGVSKHSTNTGGFQTAAVLFANNECCSPDRQPPTMLVQVTSRGMKTGLALESGLW